MPHYLEPDNQNHEPELFFAPASPPERADLVVVPMVPDVVDRNPNRVWDGLVAVGLPEPMTATAKRHRGKTVRELTEAIAAEYLGGDLEAARTDPAVPGIIRDRANAWPLHFDGATFTEDALVKWWDTLARPPMRATSRDARAVNDQLDRARLLAEAEARDAERARAARERGLAGGGA